MKIGLIGYSPQNGHPFSFSAIINGYDPLEFSKTGWAVILDYLNVRNPSEIGIPDVRVTHAWTQDKTQTELLCRACYIPHAVDSLEEMVFQVDAVIIARDDYESHVSLAKPFLQAGLPVFIDKPLTINEQELHYLMPYLEKGLCMSTSAFRYAKELDSFKQSPECIGDPYLIQAVVANDFLKYGVHMLDAVAAFHGGPLKSITKLQAPYDCFSMQLESGLVFNLSCLGAVAKVFHLSIYGRKGLFECQLTDNFSAFKRLLIRFFQMVKDRQPPIDPKQVSQIIEVLRVGHSLIPGQTAELSCVLS